MSLIKVTTELKIDEELKTLIPSLTTEEFEQLEKNILDEGIREPLITWLEPYINQDNGEEWLVDEILIDGHNRYEIAKKHNLPYKTIHKTFDSRENVIEWMILNQFGRRNLSAYHRSLLALKLKPLFEIKAKENLKGCLKSDNPIDTKKELAKVAGVGHDTISKVQKIEAKATKKIKDKLNKNEITINQAYQQIKKEEKIKNISNKFTRIEESKSIDIYNTTNKYNIILADPAWQYWDGGQKNQSLHYKTMTIDDICKLPIKDIADNDCILFLWVTFPILQDCFKVIESWGFKYSTCGFNWIKKNKSGNGNFFGCGSWTRANSELCLIATKGQVLRLDASISQVIESPIEEHSKKPAIIRELITKLVGELPRIELFSRNAVNGWDCWGNEV